MKHRMLTAATIVVPLVLSSSVYAQGTFRGAAEGADQGGRAAGPVGAATGTVGGILGVDTRPQFREYVVRERVPSYRYSSDIRVGTVLPERGVTYREVPAQFKAPGYRYTYVNDRAVIVEPRSRRIVEIID
ncbi:MAG TPA: DUF1236 domain-containing protein [Xanthobacteraceae bacterium]|nr:DUF1236 domain-containing protein [Xanthobacteraceae bacterium]